MSDTWLLVFLVLGVIVGGAGFFLMNKYRITGLVLLGLGLITFCITWIELTGIG